GRADGRVHAVPEGGGDDLDGPGKRVAASPARPRAVAGLVAGRTQDHLHRRPQRLDDGSERRLATEADAPDPRGRDRAGDVLAGREQDRLRPRGPSVADDRKWAEGAHHLAGRHVRRARRLAAAVIGRALLVAALAACVALPASSAPSRPAWVTHGPDGGGTTALEVDPRNP